MRFLYSTAIELYYLFLRFAGLFSPKARSWHYGRKSLFDKLEDVFETHYSGKNPAPVIWFHCASLGEFEQGKPVIEAVKKEFPAYHILLTFFSPSGYNHHQKYEFADHIFYLPIDTRRNARRFVNIIRPSVAIFVKYEFWFNYLNELFKREIPVFTISAIFRPNQHFFKWYGGWFRTHLRKINTIFVQDEESADLLSMIDVDNIIISGDTRFDRVASIKEQQKPFPLIDRFVEDRQVIVAGSTWPPDEELLLEFGKTSGDHIRFIIAPHETGRQRINELLQKCGDKAVLYSMAQADELNDKKYLIIDSIGILSQLYRFATIAYIGGGFGAGIHNILEAAAYGNPVFFGPNYHRFREAREMVADGTAFPVSLAMEFREKATELLSDKEALETTSHRAGAYVNNKKGATLTIMEELRKHLSGRS